MSEDDFFCGGCDSRKPIEDKRMMKNKRVICVHCKARTLKGTKPQVTGGPLRQKGSNEHSSEFVPYREII